MKIIRRIYKEFFEYTYNSEKNKIVWLDYNSSFTNRQAYVFNKLVDWGIVRQYRIPFDSNYPESILIKPADSDPFSKRIRISLDDALKRVASIHAKIYWVNTYMKGEIDNLNWCLESGIPEEELRNRNNFDFEKEASK